MKYKTYAFILLISSMSIFSFSQELDEAFLKSLPSDVASRLLEESSNKAAQESPQYRRPSTFIKKPAPTSNRFGANIFSMMQSSLMPFNEPNFDGLYILDFGDEIKLQLVGQKSSMEILRVARDGSVNIKDVGNLNIAGLSLNEAVNLIKGKINQSFIGVEAFVTLSKVRDIQIIVAGNAYNPGPYTLNGNSNVFHALSVSGGPSISGSFRSIDLIRNNKKIETIDLYQTFIFGKPSFNKRLRSGDIIFINPVSNIISIAGAVKRPGTYELISNEYLNNILIFSNGVTAYADSDNMKLERIIDGIIKDIPIINLSQFNNIKGNDGDKIFIRKYPFRSVTVSGAVLNPGTYLVNIGDNLNKAIEKAGGYTKSAYPFGAVYENQNAKIISEIALQKLYEESINSISEIIKETGSEANFAPLIGIIDQLKGSSASGRIIVDIEEENESTLLIQDGDSILIPEITNQVYLFGAISSNGSALYQEGKNLEYYIEKKGGLNSNADKNSMYVLNPNGESVKIVLNKNIFKTKAKNIEIYPGSIIYIPEEINGGYSSMLKAQAYATILGNIGVTLASLSVLKE